MKRYRIKAPILIDLPVGEEFEYIPAEYLEWDGETIWVILQNETRHKTRNKRDMLDAYLQNDCIEEVLPTRFAVQTKLTMAFRKADFSIESQIVTPEAAQYVEDDGEIAWVITYDGKRYPSETPVGLLWYHVFEGSLKKVPIV